MNKIEKKMAIIIPSLKMGGAERVATELANEFIKYGLDVSFILLDYPDIYYNIDKSIKVFFVDYNREKNVILRNLERIKKIKKIIRSNSIDTVLSFLTSANFLSILATMGTDVKVFASERSDPNKNTKKIKLIRNILYEYCDGLIFQTQDAKKCFPKSIQKKSKVIGNPIKDNLPKWDSKEEHEKNIITAVRLEQSKNIPMLLEAFERVHQIHNDYCLLIYGDGPEYNNIKEKIDSLNLSKYVILKGKNSQWHQEAVKDSIFVLSSDYEGMSNSLLEALAMGMPVISTDHPIGGAREVIINKKNGLLVPINNVEVLASTLLELIENKELSNSISKNAEKIIETMNVREISKRWLKYLFDAKEELGE